MVPQMRLTSPDIPANAPVTKASTRPPLYPLSAVTIGPSGPGGWPLLELPIYFFEKYSKPTVFQ